jgi:tetratricopeptide (TPR) repeat protein
MPFDSERESRNQVGALPDNAWDELLAKLTLNDAFWLGFVWSPVTAWLDDLQHRTSKFAAESGVAMSTLRIRTSRDLVVASETISSNERSQALLWIRFEPEADAELDIAAPRFFELLNRSRDSLRRTREGGLIIALHPDWRISFRNASPDLWSHRTLDLQLELTGLTMERTPATFDDGLDAQALLTRSRALSGSLRPEFARALRDNDPNLEGLAANESERSWVELHRFRQAATDDPVSAQKHFTALLSIGVPEAELAPLLFEAAELARHTRESTLRAQLLQTRFELLRSLLGQETESALAVLFDAAALAARVWEDTSFGSAMTMSVVTLDIAQRRVDRYGESADRLRDLARSHIQLGQVAEDRGSLATARSHGAKAQRIAEQSIALYGESPDRLTDLAESHCILGRFAEEQGDIVTASAHYTANQQLNQRTIDTYGETSDRLKNLAISHSDIGRAAYKTGDLATAQIHITNCIELTERNSETYGKTTDRLRELAVSHGDLGGLAEERFDYAYATSEYEMYRLLAQENVDTYGESSDRLRDLAVSHGLLGRAHFAQGETLAASRQYESYLRLTQKNIDEYGETTDLLHDLAVSHCNLASIHSSSSSSSKGSMTRIEHQREAVRIAQQVIDTYGETRPRVTELDRLRSDLAAIETSRRPEL